MCHYISGLIHNDFDLAELNEIGTSYSIKFADCTNDFVKKQLDNNDKYLIKNSTYCDCGTELGALQRINKRDNRRKKELDRLKKKGWSDIKIQRWIDDKKKVVVHSDIENWTTFIKDLFSQTKIKKFGIMLHWYSGNVNSEKINLREKLKIRLNELDEQKLLQIKEDAFYYIER